MILNVYSAPQLSDRVLASDAKAFDLTDDVRFSTRAKLVPKMLAEPLEAHSAFPGCFDV